MTRKAVWTPEVIAEVDLLLASGDHTTKTLAEHFGKTTKAVSQFFFKHKPEWRDRLVRGRGKDKVYGKSFCLMLTKLIDSGKSPTEISKILKLKSGCANLKSLVKRHTPDKLDAYNNLANRGKNNIWTAKSRKELGNLLKAGKTIKEISKHFNVSVGAIYSAKHKFFPKPSISGDTYKTVKWNADNVELLKGYLRANKSAQEIANLFNVRVTTIYTAKNKFVVKGHKPTAASTSKLPKAGIKVLKSRKAVSKLGEKLDYSSRDIKHKVEADTMTYIKGKGSVVALTNSQFSRHFQACTDIINTSEGEEPGLFIAAEWNKDNYKHLIDSLLGECNLWLANDRSFDDDSDVADKLIPFEGDFFDAIDSLPKRVSNILYCHFDLTCTASGAFKNKKTQLTRRLIDLALGSRLKKQCYFDITFSMRGEPRHLEAHTTFIEHVIPQIFEGCGWRVISPRQGKDLGWDYESKSSRWNNTKHRFAKYYKEAGKAETMVTALYKLVW